MKATALTHLLVLGLALITTAGCKHTTPSTTRLDSPTKKAALTDSPPYNPAEHSGSVNELPTTWTAADCDQDRSVLASATVHFDLDSVVIKTEDMDHVKEVARQLRDNAIAKLLIEGHADDRGTEEYNRSLGERRALNLRTELAKEGIDPNRIQTMTYGEDRPVDETETEIAWQKNRRGEFVLLRPRQ